MTTPTTDGQETDELRFRAMGTDVHILVVGGNRELIDQAHRRIDELERRWSRFLFDSEVSELNRRTGEAVSVSSDTVLLASRAVEAWRLSGGSVDATVLDAVIAAGYDRTFDELETAVGRRAASPAHSRAAMAAPTDIEVGPDRVRLPAGSGFDPGGIGKGLAADLVATELVAAGATNVCVNVGGDLRVAGDGSVSWTIAIEHPDRDEPITLVGLHNGAVATSTTLKRTWTVDGERRHHLIDPATGESSTSDVVLASVVAGECWVAEVLAKAALLRGSERAFDLLEPGVEALVVTTDGTVHVTEGFTAFTGGTPVPSVLPNEEEPVR